MDFLPVFLRLKQQRVLLVGGGQIALRKARLLLRAHADLTLVALHFCDELQALLKSHHQSHVRSFQDSDLDGVALVVAATDDEIVNRRISALAHARLLPVNVVDQPALCSFIFPSIIDRSPLLVAVSSGGSAPVLSRLLRARLETLIPSAYGTLVQLLGRHRDLVKNKILNTRLRMRFWEGIINGPVAELVLSGQKEKAESLFQATLSQNRSKQEQGEVYLVGAGPGDPDLLTFRALRLMQQADVVLFDRLVSPEILALVRQDAERIHVGKQRAEHTMPQEEISRLLVKLAAQGKRVLRLKGGDPFIFGRGGEEISRLAEAKIPFQIVPGITAASGCAAYAGIPLTHRDHAHSVRFVTGHLKDNSCNLDWPQLVQPGQTVVFYMGLVSLPQICEQMLLHGASTDMPIALVEQGTTPNQRVHIGSLSTLPALVATKNVQPPTLIIVGDVVKLHEQLRWREEGPP